MVAIDRAKAKRIVEALAKELDPEAFSQRANAALGPMHVKFEDAREDAYRDALEEIERIRKLPRILIDEILAFPFPDGLRLKDIGIEEFMPPERVGLRHRDGR